MSDKIKPAGAAGEDDSKHQPVLDQHESRELERYIDRVQTASLLEKSEVDALLQDVEQAELDEAEFAEFLQGHGELSGLLQGMAQPGASAELDARIFADAEMALAKAAQASQAQATQVTLSQTAQAQAGEHGSSHSLAANDPGPAGTKAPPGFFSRYRMPLGLAASVVLMMSGVMQVWRAQVVDTEPAPRLEQPAAASPAQAAAPTVVSADSASAPAVAAAEAPARSPAAPAEVPVPPAAAPAETRMAEAMPESKPMAAEKARSKLALNQQISQQTSQQIIQPSSQKPAVGAAAPTSPQVDLSGRALSRAAPPATPATPQALSAPEGANRVDSADKKLLEKSVAKMDESANAGAKGQVASAPMAEELKTVMADDADRHATHAKKAKKAIDAAPAKPTAVAPAPIVSAPAPVMARVESAPPPPPPPPPPAMPAPQLEAQVPPQAGLRAPGVSSHRTSALAPPSAMAVQPGAAWLQQIEKLIEANQGKEALEEWKKFRSAYPHYVVDKGLLMKIDGLKN